MSARIIERREDGRPEVYLCPCGGRMDYAGPGRDAECPRCGTEYNSAGQTLAPREQWGEETGETSADYYRGLNDPRHAFDG
jgi:tRNA(Ile2) C34 agmatinyltransferase TiaS